jgi:hypothetical protein
MGPCRLQLLQLLHLSRHYDRRLQCRRGIASRNACESAATIEELTRKWDDPREAESQVFSSELGRELGSALRADQNSTALAQYAGMIEKNGISRTVPNTSVVQAQKDEVGPTTSIS